MRKFLSVVIWILLTSCVHEFLGDYVVIREMSKDVEHRLYFQGITKSDAHMYAEQLRVKGGFHAKKNLEYQLVRVDSAHWKWNMPLESEEHASLFWQAQIALIELDLEALTHGDVQVTYFDPDLGLSDGIAFDFLSNEKFLWMLPAEGPLDSLEVAVNVKGQVDFLKRSLAEGLEKGYTSMRFGSMPLHIYLAVNGLGAIPKEQLSQKAQEIYYDIAGNQLAYQFLVESFSKVNWTNASGNVFRAHYGALSKGRL